MNILILEDEIPAFEKLLAYLKEHFKDALKYDWARTVEEGKEFLLGSNDYSIILSDIELLDGTAFELFKEIPCNCPIIFCSAYDKYLFDAFSSNGIAYVLKPYTSADLQSAFAKYENLFKTQEFKSFDGGIMNEFTDILLQNKVNFKERFLIKTPNGIYLLNTTDISLVIAAGSFCKVIDRSGKVHLLSRSIGTLVEILDPRKFFRVNRSQMVNIDYIESMQSHFKNRLSIRMKGTKEKVLTSSNTTAKFKSWLEK